MVLLLYQGYVQVVILLGGAIVVTNSDAVVGKRRVLSRGNGRIGLVVMYDSTVSQVCWLIVW